MVAISDTGARAPLVGAHPLQLVRAAAAAAGQEDAAKGSVCWSDCVSKGRCW